MASYNPVGTRKNADQPINVTLIDYLDQNPHAMFEGASGAPKLQTAAIQDNAVTEAKLATGSVHQGQIDVGTNSISTINSGPTHFTLAGGFFNFWPQVYVANGSYNIDVAPSENFSGTSSVANISISISANNVTTGYIDNRYVNSSPPHKIDSVDYDQFIFLALDNNGNILSTWLATDPPWYHNGPTKVAPNMPSAGGKKYRRDLLIPKEIRETKAKDPKKYYKELSKIKPTEYEITPEIKNADIDLLPHPFPSHKNDNIVIIEPSQDGDYMDVCSLLKQGENVCELIHEGYLKVDNTEINTSGRPPGVPMHRIKWK